MSCARLRNFIGTRTFSNLALKSPRHQSIYRASSLYNCSSNFSIINRPTASKLISRQAALRPHNNRLGLSKSTAFVRHCSCRRMCKRDDHTTSMDVTKGREILPANVKPTHYDITLEPDLEAFTYTGKVIIELVPLQSRRMNYC